MIFVYHLQGYKTRGHGYFIEDGWEKGSEIVHNLGMVTHQGITLPTDKGHYLCESAREGYNGTFVHACRALSMFWISEIRTILNDNVAIGGKVGYWFIPHNGQHHGCSMVRPLQSFKNNRASACDSGLQVEAAVEERDPDETRDTPFLGKVGFRQAASLDGPDGKARVF